MSAVNHLYWINEYLALVNLKAIVMKSVGKIISALAAGVAVGALLGVLFAPDKGSETRKKMDKRGKKMADDLKDTFNAAKEKLEGLKEELKQAGKESPNEFI